MKFLRQIRERMPHVLAETSIDYMTMTRTCCAILRQVRDEIGRRLDNRHHTKDWADSSKPGFLITSMIILRESGDAEMLQDHLLRGKRLIQAGPQLKVAGRVLTDFLVAQQIADNAGG